MDYKVPGHSIYAEMEDVHDKMISRYEVDNSGDIERAEKMESYLRYFKKVGRHTEAGKANLVGDLEYQALGDLSDDINTALGLNRSTIFRSRHSKYRDKQGLWGVDDIFEAELKELLNAAVKKATSNTGTADAKTLGQLDGNIATEFLQSMSEEGQLIIDKEYQTSFLIEKPTFRSQKIDVQSFTGEFSIDTQIKPEWREFIEVFSGANFTVKNYSNSQYDTIHLGRTVLPKAVGGILSVLYPAKQATHIYYHAISYVNKSDKEVSSHILHLRFAYELTGDGLYDKEGHQLSAADFFVYNNPDSDDIWVRSTKAMISEAMDYMTEVTDPYLSEIRILKGSFI